MPCHGFWGRLTLQFHTTAIDGRRREHVMGIMVGPRLGNLAVRSSMMWTGTPGPLALTSTRPMPGVKGCGVPTSAYQGNEGIYMVRRRSARFGKSFDHCSRVRVDVIRLVASTANTMIVMSELANKAARLLPPPFPASTIETMTQQSWMYNA